MQHSVNDSTVVDSQGYIIGYNLQNKSKTRQSPIVKYPADECLTLGLGAGSNIRLFKVVEVRQDFSQEF